MLKWIGENGIYQSFDTKSLANLYLQSAQMMETKALCCLSGLLLCYYKFWMQIIRASNL